MKERKVEKEFLVSLFIICIIICSVLFGCAWGKMYCSSFKVELANEENNNNLYAEFLKNRKENINGKYKNIDNYDESIDYNDDEHLDFEESLDMGTNRIQTYLNDSGLTIESNDKTIKKIDDVIYSKIIFPGTAPVCDIYYINSDGEVYDVNISLNENNEAVIDDIKVLSNLNRIVSIEPSWYGVRSGSVVATFIDIEGNIYTEE